MTKTKIITTLILTTVILTGCNLNYNVNGNKRIYTEVMKETSQPNRVIHYKPEILTNKGVSKIKISLKEKMAKEGYFLFGDNDHVIAFQKDQSINSTNRIYFSINKYQKGNRVIGQYFTVSYKNTEDETISPYTSHTDLVKYQMVLESIK